MEEFNNSEEYSEEHPTGERWDPLGAPNDQDEDFLSLKRYDGECNEHTCEYVEKYKNLEEEQDLLSSSLFALTTHFAQVQFRLRQIVDAPAADKDKLFNSLEEFAFRGIPDINSVCEKYNDATIVEALELRRTEQQELIDKLKTQLHELEQYAYESGQAGVPQDTVLERQRFILNELKDRMNLELDEDMYDEMTPENVKEQVEMALGQFKNPLKMKEHLVAQLKTQVADLERFINYLQADMKNMKCACGCNIHPVEKSFKNNTGTAGILRNTAELLQMFALLQLGCGGGRNGESRRPQPQQPHQQKFKKNNLKNTMKFNHYGDLRARLEVSICRVKDFLNAAADADSSQYSSLHEGDYSSDNPDTPSVLCNVQVTTAVRKYLAASIRALIEHGAAAAVGNGHGGGSVVPFIGCFARTSHGADSSAAAAIHAWQIVLEYYEFKNGDRFNSTPARKLSQSFNLDIAGSSATSNKQNMLCAIGSIISTHTAYKRSYDSHFKAFICAALNVNKLVTWLSLIFQCRQLINMHYHPWSYVMKTGFKDSLQSLDTLTKYKFDLPVDLAIRQFQNIKDVFN